MPSTPRHLHAFDLRSVVLFTSLTLGGTSAVLAQPAPAAPASAVASPRQQPITPTESFTRSDINRDGNLSRSEAQNLPAVAEQFDAWDRDGNGQLSLEEFLLHTTPQKPSE